MESYKVQCSLRNMAAAQLEGYTKVRFWGKILGTDADYYVAEAEKDGGDGEEAEDPDQEASGSPGTNFFIYFVCTDLSGAWTKLPNIRPKDIVAAKKIKKMFSGNPDAKVITHPYFDGLEKVLLRATIARITADTTICLKGMLIREEDAEEVTKPEEFKWPMPSELTEKKAWIHTQPHILNIGRTTHKELPDAEEDPAGFAEAKEQQEADPAKDMIRSVDGDGLAWNIKQFGDMALYKAANGTAKSNAVTCVRSLTWPGAVTVSRGQYYTSLYIGNGQEAKAGNPEFFIPAPPDVQDEPEDTPEPEEPQGTPEPVGGEEAAEE
jgi:radial spoke head protein 4A